MNERLQAGFTLLELLVALAVFAILSVVAYGGLRSVLFTEVAIEAEAQRLAQVQMAFHILEQDVIQTVSRSIRDEFGQRQAALVSGGLQDDLFILTRTGWDNPLNRARPSLQRLSYRWENNQLYRLQWDVLDRVGLTEPRETLLLDRIGEVQIRFLDQDDSWQTVWPPTTNSAEANLDLLPRAVEVQILLEDWGEITRLLVIPNS
ncbi:MAG: type II secretion system minor pseudopilin GspJ [Candidatus Competibacteraceae bacterium]|jgi:general secretion pathway protein J|nr:type II secretion system minor pseudopilin GspJ [Candidatus Competibacteraceae bacterium]